MDALALQAVTDECRDLEGARIVAIEQSGPMDIGLALRNSSGKRFLSLSVQPGFARIHVSDTPRKSVVSSALLAALRDRLIPGQLEKIEATPFERVAEIRCLAKSSPGPRGYRLIAELIGNRGILVLVSEPDQVILETLRRIQGTGRRLVPGETYAFPPPMKKTPLTEATRELLAGTGGLPTPEDLTRRLTDSFSGLSKATALELLAHAGLAEPADFAHSDAEERIDKIWHSLQALNHRVQARVWSPCIGRSPDGRARLVSAVPIHSLPAEQVESCASISNAVERFYEERMAEEATKQRKLKVQAALRAEIRRLERLNGNLARDLEHVEREEEYRRFGDLITSHMDRLKAGLSEARVEDYFSGSREEVAIPLKPGLSPSENARWYFRQARKARDGRRAVEQRIVRARARLKDVMDIHEMLEPEMDEKTLNQVHRACVKLEIIKAPRKNAAATGKIGASKRSRKQAKREIHPRRYLTSGGHLLLVGRNSRENEALTKSAAPDDIWLHARDLGGSHVILRRSDKTQMPSRKALYEAACLTAYFSRGRGSGTVPVDYTERRYVRKMKNGAPGQVVFTREKTLFVEPKLALRLADSPETPDSG